MTLARVTPPAALAVTEQEAWAHLRLILQENGESPPEAVPEDREHVRLLLEAAIGEVDGAEGILSRALISQTWALKLDCFPWAITLPLPPCQSVDSITYIDTAGATQTLDPSGYTVAGLASMDKAVITAAGGTRWPSTKDVPEAVTVTFTAGFGDAAEDIPPLIRLGILEIVAARYAFRETITPASQYYALPRSATEALEAYRVRAF